MQLQQQSPRRFKAVATLAALFHNLKNAARRQPSATLPFESLESRRHMSSVLQPADAVTPDAAELVGPFAAPVTPTAPPDADAGSAAETAPSKAAKPTVALTAAASADAAPATITLTADATDPDGAVARVDFYRGSKKLGTDTEAPFTWAIDDAGRGAYSFAAKAFDTTGLAARSNVVNLKIAAAADTAAPAPAPAPDPAPVPDPSPTPDPAPEPTPSPDPAPSPTPTAPEGDEAPTVKLVNPASGKYAGPGYWALRADASDADGTVTHVDFVVDGNVVATASAAPFIAPWTNVAPGTYRVSAVAYDDAGKSTTSDEVKVTVEEPAGGRTIHVSPSGSAGGSGAADAPIDSINTAMSLAEPGDTVLVAPGTYAEEITVNHGGTRQKPIVLKADQPGTVVIDGQGQRSTLLAPASKSAGKYVWLSGITFRNADNGAGGYQAAVRTSDGWRVEDCLIEKVDGNGLGMFGSNVIVRNVTAQDNGVSGISGSSLHESLLLDSTTRHNNLNVQTSEGGGGKITRSNGLLVDNLDACDNNGPGFWFDIDNINCVVQNSKFHDNVTLKKPDGSDRITGRGLFLEISGVDSDGNGKAIDAGALLVKDNLATGNGSSGFTVYATGNAHLTGNTVVDDVVEVKDKRPAPYSVHNLTIEDNAFKNGMITIDGASTSKYASRRYKIDGNTYDNRGNDPILNWSGKKYASPSSVFDALGFEKSGKRGDVNAPTTAD